MLVRALRLSFVRGVRHHEEAARRHGVAVAGDDRGRVVGVRHEVQDRDHHHGHRLAEIEQAGDLGQLQQQVGAAQVGLHHRGQRVVAEDRAAVGDGDRVDVGVHHPCVRRRRPGDLVHVADGGDTGAQVQELAHTGGDAEPHRPAQERPVGLHDQRKVRPHRDGLLGHLAVRGEVVGTAEVVVVHTGSAGAGEVDLVRHRARFQWHGVPRFPRPAEVTLIKPTR